MLGEEHPDAAQSLNNLALLRAAQGRAGEGIALSQQVVRSTARLLETSAAVQSERQQLAMAQALGNRAHALLSLAHLAQLPAAQVYADLMPLKGQVLLRQRPMRQLRLQAAAEPDGPVARAFLELSDRTRQLDRLAKLVPPPEQRDAHRRKLEELTLHIERLQQALAAASAVYRRAQQQAALRPAELAAQLPAGTALVDLWQYDQFLPPDEKHPPQRWEPQYVAFVVRPQRGVCAVWLGAAAPIDDAVATWRGRRMAGGQQIHVVPGTGAEAAQAARLLRQRVWEPLVEHLGGVQTVLVSPDGALNGFPLAALPGRQPGTYVIEDGPAIVTVAAPLLLPELLARASEPAGVPSLLAIGDVDYGADPGALQLAAAHRGAAAARGSALWQWQPLPGARVEVLAIADRFSRTFRGAPSLLLREEEATEQAVRQQAARASYLHFATHGYFAPPTLRSVLSASRGEQDASSLFQRQDVAGWHPGLLSGIVLAGANRPADPQRDDGILTAVEVAALDLGRVEMVVLSACDTGLGATAGGEGLLGLQRAFQLAGARSTVASLWEVPDQATRALMVEFYDNLWHKKLPRAEALRQAQLAVMKDTSLRGADPLLDDAATPRLPPYYWAAFVLSGDWR